MGLGRSARSDCRHRRLVRHNRSAGECECNAHSWRVESARARARVSRMQKQLVVAGAHSIAEVAFEYFTHDSPYEDAAFTVERAFIERDALFGRPVVPFEEIADR